MGLAAVYTAAERHGGRVTVATGPAGTRVALELPAAAGAGRSTPAAARSAPGAVPAAVAPRVLLAEDEPSVREVAVRTLRRAGFEPVPPAFPRTRGDAMSETPPRPRGAVLVVDDDPGSRRVAERTLTRTGFRCETAEDGAAAPAAFAAGGRFDAAVTDLRMPNPDGRALCEDLLARPDRPAAVVLTGVIEPATEAALTARGLARILFKPANPLALRRTVEEVLATQGEGCGAAANSATSFRAGG